MLHYFHTSCHTPVKDLCTDRTPAFGHIGITACPAPAKNQPFVKKPKSNGDNRRKRKADQKSKVPGPRSTVFESACSQDSQMGQTNEELGINHVRLCKERINLCDPDCCDQLDYQIRAAAESRHHIFGVPLIALRDLRDNISILQKAVRDSKCILVS